MAGLRGRFGPRTGAAQLGMTTTFTMRRVSCSALAVTVMLAAGCTSPFSRTPLSPAAYHEAERVHRDGTADGPQSFELVGFPDTWEPQVEAELCWAACATMIHRWQGESVSKEDIVDRMRERAQDDEDPAGVSDRTAADKAERLCAASEHEILLALAPDRKELLDRLWDECWTHVGEALGEQLVAQTDEERAAAEQKLGEELGKALVSGLSYLPQTMDLDSVMADLQDGHPVVVGLQQTDEDGVTYGHACVIYGLTATYREPDGVLDGVAAMGNAMLGVAGTGHGFKGESGYTYLTVKLIDPALEGPGTREMSVSDLLARADFFASRPFAEAVLDSQAQGMQQPTFASIAAAQLADAGLPDE